MRRYTMERIVLGFMTLLTVSLTIIFPVGIIYVAIHFISKWW